MDGGFSAGKLIYYNTPQKLPDKVFDNDLPLPKRAGWTDDAGINMPAGPHLEPN
jgi:hypothetical protein